MMRPAIIACISVSCGSSASRKRRHSVTGRSQNSEIFIPPTVTARTSFRRRRPPQSGQGVSAMHCSISARMAGLCVFAVTALEVGRDALEGLVERSLAALLIVMERQLFAARAVEDHFARLFRQVTDGGIKTEMVFFRECFKIHARDRRRRGHCSSRTLRCRRREWRRRVRHNELGSTRSCVPRPVQLGQAP